MPLAEIFVLALASMVWPALVAVVVVALASPQPVKLLSVFLVASLLTTVTIGLVIVFVLRGSSLFSGSRPAFGPAVDLAAGVVALIAGLIVRRGGSEEKLKHDGPSWTERTLSRGAPLAFVAGVVLNIVPGVFPFVAMKNIAGLDYPPAASAVLVVGFYLIMFLPAEVPLGCYFFAPARTSVEVGRFNRWLAHNVRRIAAVTLLVVGTYLVVRGIVGL